MAANQTEIFEQAKQSIASELDGEILAWDFSTMLSQLRAVIATKDEATHHNGIRFFCRHYLDMHGSSFNDMRHWLLEKAVMPFDKIESVLRVLKAERDGTLIAGPASAGGPKQNRDHKKPPREPKAKKVRRSEEEPRQLQPQVPKTAGMIRKLIDHTTTLFNSLMILVLEAGVNPDDLYDGDRIQIRIALKKVCDAFGIDVVFPEPEAARNQPVTRQDLADLGVTKSRQRRKRS